MKDTCRKFYCEHGFLVQKRVGKKWTDWQGVAGTTDDILSMQGTPSEWKKQEAGFYIDKDAKNFPDYK